MRQCASDECFVKNDEGFDVPILFLIFWAALFVDGFIIKLGGGCASSFPYLSYSVYLYRSLGKRSSRAKAKIGRGGEGRVEKDAGSEKDTVLELRENWRKAKI